MDQRLFLEVRGWFERIVELDGPARDAALATIEDARVRAQVRALLVADDDPRPLDFSVPTQVGAYRVVRERGRGGMGVVYEADAEAPRRRVALKILHPWVRSPAIDELARREAQALADLRHAAIPTVYTLLETERGPVVVMELVEGVPLRHAMEHAPLRARLAGLIAVVSAVGAAHARGIVHRDLKPENLVLRPDGQPVVLDFGLAAGVGERSATGGGTPRYMAPEQGKGVPVDARSDVYALGVIAREVLGPDADLPAFSGLLARATAADPAARPPDAGVLADELGRAAAGFARRRWTAGIVPVAVVLVALLAYLATVRSPREAPEEAELRALAARPGVTEAELGGRLVDPRLVGTKALSDAWSALASSTTEDEVRRRAGAWVHDPTAGEATQAALATALQRAGWTEAAARLGLPVWTPGEGEPGPADVDVGDWRDGPWVGRGERLEALGRQWSLPGTIHQLRATEGPGLALGDGWLATLGDPPQVFKFRRPLSDAAWVEEPAGVVMAWRVDGGGLSFAPAGGEPVAIPGTLGLPVRAVAVVPHRGRSVLLAAVTGWSGHELRLLVPGPSGWGTADRVRVAAWDVVASGPDAAWMVGGPVPTEASPHGERRWLVPIRLEEDRLVDGAPVDLGGQVLDLFGGLGPLWFHGRSGVGTLVGDEARWMPGLQVLGVAPGVAWLDRGGESRIFRQGALTPGPPRPIAEPAVPRGVARGLVPAWQRAATLQLLGQDASRWFAEIAVASALPLEALVEHADGDPVYGLAAARLGAGIAGPGAALVVAAHAFDEPTTLPVAATLDPREPLPAYLHAGGVGAVRRDLLAGALDIDLFPGDPPALSVPIVVGDGPWCVELELEAVDLDWSAGIGLSVGGEGGATAPEAAAEPLIVGLRHVGGGPVAGHRLNLGIVEGRATRVPFDQAPHHVSACFGAGRGSVRLDREARVVAPVAGLPGPGATRLGLGFVPEVAEETVVRARVRLRRLALRGATFGSAPGDDRAAARACAEGDRAALQAAASSAEAEPAALARLALGEPAPASLAAAPERLLLRLLRRAPDWAWPAVRGRGDAVSLLGRAWDIPASYDPERAGAALGLLDLPPGQPGSTGLLLARATGLLAAGRLAAARAELDRLGDEDAAALVILARLYARSGQPDATRRVLARLRDHPSRRALDLVVDDAELAGLVPPEDVPRKIVFPAP